MSINLHSGQSEVFEDLFVNKSARYAVVCCARGWGKSYMASVSAITAVFELMCLAEKVPNKVVYIVAPTYDQVTDIYYPLINYDLGMDQYAISSSQALGRFIFPGKVELRLLSYEAVQRMRGKGCYFFVWDEVSSCTKGIKPKEAWQGVIQPTIITRWSEYRSKIYGAKSPGRGLIIGTPKGYNFFHELYNYRENDNDWKSYHYDYRESPFLDPTEIEKLKGMLDPVEWASEYLASFADSGHNVFYCFDRNKHVTNQLVDFTKNEDVHFNIDFNVGIQATSVFALRGNQMQFLDEFKGHPDTESLASTLSRRYKGHKMYAYPDPTGRSRKTSAAVGKTDFSILESYGIKCRARLKSPPIVDSVAAVNRQLKTATGNINMLFHPKCVGTIQSIERTKWLDKNPDSATIDKKDGVEHFSDGVRYGTEFLFPVRTGSTHVHKGFGF